MADAQIRITADTRQAERALGDLNSALKNLASIAIGGSLAQQFVQLTSNVQEMTNKLIFATGSVKDANAAFNLLSSTAKATGSNLGGTVDLYQKLAQSATFAGSRSETLAVITSNFNKTLQISGASGAGAAAALYQFAQAMQKGTLNGDEFRTIMETNGYLLKVLEQQTGKSRTELIKMASDGKLSAEIVGKALLESTQISEDYGKTIRTLPQAFENFQTALTQVVARMNQVTGAGTGMVKVLEWLSNNQGALTGGIIALSGALATLALRFAAVRAAMITSGWGALIVGAGVAVGYLADKMGAFGDATEDAAANSDKINQAARDGLVINHQRNQQALDLDASLVKQLGLQEAISAINMKSTGHISIQLEIERALVTERAKYLATGEKMSQQQEAAIAQATRNKILSDEHMSIQKEMGDLYDRIALAQIGTGDRLTMQTEMLRMQSKYSAETYMNYREEYKALLLQTEQMETQAKLRDLMRTTPTQGEIATVGASAIQNTARGMGVDFAKQTAILKQLNEMKLLSDQEYADAKMLLLQKTGQAELALEQQIADARMRINGVTNQAIIDAVTAQMANVKMMQAGGIAGAQGVLGALTQITGTMANTSKSAFEMHKKLAIAQAMISTFQAATMAIAAPPGPPFSYLYVATAIAAGMAQIAQIRSQQYSGRALGGPVMGNTPYIVGERGPELFTPSSSGSITRNDQLGGGNVNVNFSIVANDTNGFDSLLNSRKGMIKQMISDAMLEKGQRF